MSKGGTPSAPSGGNNNLWNTQAEQVRQSMAMSGEMFDYWRKYAPGYLDSTAAMVQEAQDGTLAARARNQASADAMTSMGAGLAAANRNMERYGAEFNPTKANYAARDAGITGALARTDAMNKASQWAENQRWARNQDALGQVSGMPGNATQMLGSANSGMGNLASMQNSANSMAAQNAAGYGQMGASLAYSLFKKDGGRIAHPARHGLRLAMGGSPAANNPVKGWRERMAEMPSLSMSSNGSGSAVGQMLAGALPVAAAQLAKPAAMGLWEAGKSALLGQAANAGAGITGSIAAPALANAAATGAAAGAAGTAASGIGAGALGSGVSGGLATGLSSGAAGAAAGTAASGVGGAALGSGVSGSIAPVLASAAEGAAAGSAATAGAANAWNPIGWGLLAAGALTALSDAFADGGQAREDMTPGGKVEGEGTPTSDSIPAWLSDEEYVLNAEAVKEIGLKKLDAMNEKGLKKRYGKQARMVGGVAHPDGKNGKGGNKLALGGNLGIALGAAANEWSRQREQDRRDAEAKMREEQFKLQQAQDARAAATHDAAMQDRADKKAKEAKIAAVLKEYADGMRQMQSGVQALADGKLSAQDFASSVAPQYSQFINDGKSLQAQADGSFALTDGQNVTKMNANDAARYLASPEMEARSLFDLTKRLAAIDPSYASQLAPMIGKQLESHWKNREFDRQLRRDDVADKQFMMKFNQDARQHAASAGLGWARLNLDKAEKAEKRRMENEKVEAAVGYYKQLHPEATDTDLRAVRAGVLSAIPKEDKVRNEYTFMQNPMGMGGTRVNKDTGEVQGINGRGEVVYTLPAAQGVKPALSQKPSQRAIDALKASPDKAAEFDAMFGQGSSAKILGKGG